MEYEVKHNEAESRFEVEIDGLLSVIEYVTIGNVIDIYHTGVPQELSGRGIAAALAKTILEYAKERGLEVKPTCSYVQKYMERHS